MSVVPLNQADPRWANFPLDIYNNPQKTIGRWGCLSVAYTMLINQFRDEGDALTPLDVVTRFKQTGSLSLAGDLRSGGLTNAYPYAFVYDGWEYASAPTAKNNLLALLSQGVPVPCRVDYRPATVAEEQHWVLVTDVINGVFWCADPIDGTMARVSSRYGAKGIDGIREILRYRPIKLSHPLAIDVSRWQKFSSYKYALEGVSFLIAKASEAGFPDSEYATHINGATAQKVPYSAYHFLRPQKQASIAAQVGIFREQLAKFPRTHISFIDYEADATYADLVAFIGEYEKQLGEQIGLYTNWSRLKDLPKSLIINRPIWIAQYGVQSPTPINGAKYALHQFTDTGRVAAHSGTIDWNAILSPLSELLIKKTEPDAPIVTPQGREFDMADYIVGDGRIYEVRHSSGSTETFQTQRNGQYAYQVKNNQWEEFVVRDNHICRGLDTSPGGGRFYRQYDDGDSVARWCPRRARVGDRWAFSPPHHVQFYLKVDCRQSAENSGIATNAGHFVAHHPSKTWNGVMVDDVIEIAGGEERFFYARGYGLVAWESSWGTSAICEKLADRRPLARESIPCFG